MLSMATYDQFSRPCQAYDAANNASGYLNMSCYNEDGEALVQNTYKSNYDRLRTIKKKYDPTNFFRLNANIIPAD